MISNLRARPIQGYVTDSAGNVLRNANIVIYRNTPSGLLPVDSTSSNDEGYFISNPLPNGVYDIFESGIRTARIIHNPDQNSIQCFKASKDNYYESDIIPFSSLVNPNNPKLNNFKYFIQIEPEEMSVDILGNMFPLYDFDLSNLASNSGEIYDLIKFLNIRTHSRITISRFDVEYFLPLTAAQTSYRRIKWAGVPGIRYKPDSKIVLPLDYFSIVANNPFIISNNGSDFNGVKIENVSGSGIGHDNQIITIKGNSNLSAYISIYNNVGIGDILKLTMNAAPGSLFWYGIVVQKVSYNIILEKWKSSRFLSNYSPIIGNNVFSIKAYHGMFQGMTSMSSTVSECFNVVENNYQQVLGTELYNYCGRYTS